MTSAEPLHALAQMLGIDKQRLAQAENPIRLAGTFTVPGTAVARLTDEMLAGLVSAYADAFRLTVRIGVLDELVVDGTFADEDLARLVQAAPGTPSYEIVLQIDKEALVRGILGDTPGSRTVLYFHHDALVAALRAGLRSIEQDLWQNTERRLVLLVLDRDIALSGDMLSILGGTQLNQAPDETSVAPRPSSDAARARRRRDDYIGWDSDLVTALTPWHFAYNDATGEPSILAQVDATFVLLAVLFTCDRARAVARPGGPPRIQPEFRGREHVAFVPINRGATLEGISAAQRAAIRSLLDWCYQAHATEPGRSDWLADRLPFVQMRVAQALEGRAAEDRFRVYATAMPEILEGAQWHWRAFLEGRVSDYLDRVQTLEATVADAVERYAERTTALVKGLSDAILAAVAALIGSFIAAAFKDPFNATLFRIGMFTYAGYVLIFPGILGLLAGRGHANEVHSSFAAQRMRFEEALYPAKVKEIIGERVSKAKTRYHRWWVGVGLCYLLITIAAVVGALAVPEHVT